MTDHFTFGAASQAKLATCIPALQAVLRLALQMSPIDFTLLEGHRGEAAQDRAFENGRSRLRWPNGKHNHMPSHAVDIAPWPIDWNDRERFVFVAGVMACAAHLEGVSLRWGGDWDSDGHMTDESFRDLGHFEVDLPVQG